MPQLLRRLKETYPSVDIFIYSDRAANLVKALSMGKLDMIYINRDIPYPGLHSEPIRNDHLLLAISPDLPANAHAARLNNYQLPYLDLKYIENETFFLMEEGRPSGLWLIRPCITAESSLAWNLLLMPLT